MRVQQLFVTPTAELVVVMILMLGGCSSNPFTPGYWDKTEKADLARYGPTLDQRIDQMAELAEQAADGTPEEQERAAAQLAQALANEASPLVRSGIVRSLRQLKTETSAAVLSSALKDPDPDVRVAACDALATWKDTRYAGPLAETLSSDTNVDVRLAAARALGNTPDQKAIAALGIALEDSDPAMQLRAVESLRVVTGKDLGNDVNEWRRFVQSQPAPKQAPTSIADRLNQLF